MEQVVLVDELSRPRADPLFWAVQLVLHHLVREDEQSALLLYHLDFQSQLRHHHLAEQGDH